MKIILIDYGIGNLRSVRKALEQVGAQVLQTSSLEVILTGDKVVLPGVGAFRDGMIGLQKRGLIPAINEVVERQIPLLGICLGMQLFFDHSPEMGNTPGLGFISGVVSEFSLDGLKIPQTGWNQLNLATRPPLLKGINEGSYVYFNHSFYCEPADPSVTVSNTDYGLHFASAIQSGSIYGVQFHPEKSQVVGLRILRNFVEVCQ